MSNMIQKSEERERARERERESERAGWILEKVEEKEGDLSWPNLTLRIIGEEMIAEWCSRSRACPHPVYLTFTSFTL